MGGKLIIFSAPSGSGKTTIVKELSKAYTNLGFSISATTRSKRGEEIDGKDYYFLSVEDFEDKIEDDQFAEFEEVYKGRYYGTLKPEIERLWAKGKHVLFDVDVKGGINLKRVYRQKALAIFVKVPSLNELETRLRARGTEDEENIKMRLAKVVEENKYADQFDRIIINDAIENAVAQAKELIDCFLKE